MTLKTIAEKTYRAMKWLVPGMRVKRYLLMMLLGVALFAAGILLLFRKQQLPSSIENLPRYWGLPFIIGGLAIVAAGSQRLNRSILQVVAPRSVERTVDMVYARRYLARRPHIACIGGGTGLHTLLRGLKEYTSNLTAIVTVGDDGGSSGRLRREMGIIPPGDIRNCLIALSEVEPMLECLMDYRFTEGELSGHSVGNLLIAAMTRITGRFDHAVRELAQVLAVRGRVLPSANQPVVLTAKMKDGTIVQGESLIPEAHKAIEDIAIEPAAEANPEVLEALETARAIILGPGSLFTSIVPNLLVKGVCEAISRSHATVIFVCNIFTQPGETDGFTAEDHLRIIQKYVDRVDYIVINRGIPENLRRRYQLEGQEPVRYDERALRKMGVIPVVRDLLDTRSEFARHHPDALRKVVEELLD
ncbi:MAG: gluconeogenesis factor YvcK family protein [bacterium JZ-2024 1]